MMGGKVLVFCGRWGTVGRNVVLNGHSYPFEEVYVVSSSPSDGLYAGICAESNLGVRYPDSVLILKKELWKLISNLRKRDKEIYLFPFVFMKEMDFGTDVHLIQNPFYVCAYCESKANFEQILLESGVDDRYKVTYYDLDAPLTYRDIAERLGVKFLLQCDSMGGKGTWLIENAGQLETVGISEVSRISKYVDGKVFNVNVLSVSRGTSAVDVYVEIPSFKPMGIVEVCGNGFGSCGNEWGRYSLKDFDQCILQIEKIGRYLYKKYAFEGIWGIDFIYDEAVGEYKLIEMNARMQGTTEAAALCQVQRDFYPFSYIVCCRAAGKQQRFISSEEYNARTAGLAEHGLTFSPFYVKIKRDRDIVFQPSDEFKGNGMYQMEKDKLKFVIPDLNALHACADEGRMLICNSPDRGTVVSKGVEICTVEGIKTSNVLIFQSNNELSKYGKRIAEAVSELLALRI